jgi:Transposase and inactivated derivatives
MTLREENALLKQEIVELKQLVAKLQQRLLEYEVKKDSSNSSIPPSQDSFRPKRTSSLREKSDKKSGGQTGHQGVTLLMKEEVDETQMHSPDYCFRCGKSLSDISGNPSEIRQSIDIPLPIRPIVINHISIEKHCTCGACTKGSFPDYVKSGVSYGVNIHALVAYLSTIQSIPFKRLTIILKDFYGLEISQGTVSNILNRMRKQAKPAYEAIRNQIEKSPVVGADETGERLNGELHWMWTFQNDYLTYIYQDPSRGKAAIDKHFPQGLPQSILLSDRHSSYFNMDTTGHQLCLAHLLRELTYLGELDKKQKWSFEFLELFRESIHVKKRLPLAEIDVGNIKQRFDILIHEDLSKLDEKFRTLQKSLAKHSQHVFMFLEHEQVPYDNNASERSIRPLKVKQKVSGMFKSDYGADNFCTIHSIVDTAKKNQQDPFLTLVAVAQNIISERGE